MKSEQVSKRVKLGKHTSIRHLNLVDSVKLVLDQMQDPEQKIIEEKMTSLNQTNKYRAQCQEIILGVIYQIESNEAKTALVSLKLFMLEHFKWVFENDSRTQGFVYEIERQELAVSTENSIYIRIRRKRNED